MQKWLFGLSTFLILALSYSANAQFHSIKYAPEHALETPVHLTQGINGQIWLFSDSSVSLFSGDQFVSYQTFTLDSHIQSGLVLEDGFLFATESQLLFSSKTSLDKTPVAIWQGQNESIQVLHHSNETVFVQTSEAIYAVTLFPQTYEVQQIHKFTQPVIDFVVGSKFIYILHADSLISLPLDGSGINTYQHTLNLTQLGLNNSELFALDSSAELLSIGWSGNALLAEKLGVSANNLFSANGLLYFSNGNSLYAYNSLSGQQSLPVSTSQIFIDLDSNLWLINPYDIQVQWHQRLQMQATDAVNTNQFELLADDFAMKQGNLYQKGNNGNWQLTATLPNFVSSESMFTTRDSLWFVNQGLLSAVNQRSLVTTVEFNLNSTSWVAQSANNKVVLVKDNQIIELASNGFQKVVRQCEASCLPDYKINSSYWDGRRLWLATSQGLHELSLTDWQFSIERLDGYNALSPLLQVAKQKKQ